MGALPPREAASEPVAPPVPPPAPAAAPLVSRQDWTNRLWGEGMAIPGGAAEVLRLAGLLPLVPEATLLLAGGGARAAGGVVSGARGCFVAAFEPGMPEPSPGARSRTPGRKVEAEPFDATAPAFRPGYHHHALLLEPFRSGGTPDVLLRAAARGLRQGGQVVLVDIAACDGGPHSADARWIAAEGRTAAPPAETAISAALEGAGFAINVVEDAAPRHRRAVIESWQALILAMRAQAERPSPQAAATLIAEAEAWLLRLRLLADGRLRLLRWHASMARRLG